MVPGVLSRVLATLLGHAGSEPNPQTEKLKASQESVSYPRLPSAAGSGRQLATVSSSSARPVIACSVRTVVSMSSMSN